MTIHEQLAEPWRDIDLTDPVAVLAHALATHESAVALACSFGLEDVVLVDMLMSIDPGARVFALDTGRLNPETYECADAIRRKYGLSVEWYCPKHDAVEQLVRGKGLFSFRESVENRKECCFLRKVEPLTRALAGLDAWITGMRREQNVTRTRLNVVEMDEAHGGIVKVNPLAAWSLADTWAYVREHDVPYNALHSRGYPSIGCAPCTRAIAPGEDSRAGRWWWEQPEHKECGLHLGVDVEKGEGI